MEVKICYQIGSLDKLVIEAKNSRTQIPQSALDLIRQISDDAHDLSGMAPDNSTYRTMDMTAVAMYTRASQGETSWILDLVNLEMACGDLQIPGFQSAAP